MEKIERPEQTEQNALRGFYTFGSTLLRSTILLFRRESTATRSFNQRKEVMKVLKVVCS